MSEPNRLRARRSPNRPPLPLALLSLALLHAQGAGAQQQPQAASWADAPLVLKRSAQLLDVARKHPDFPIILETYREILSDVFDVPALKEVLGGIRSRAIRVAAVETRSASPVTGWPAPAEP